MHNTNGRKEADAVANCGDDARSGLTPLGTALDQKIIQPLVLGPAQRNALQKPVLIIAVSLE
jgi:hypothetical protein